mgnify:CR=1 FL=1
MIAATLGAQTFRDNVTIYVNHEDGLYEKCDLVKVWADAKTVPDGDIWLYVIKACNRKNAVAK